MTDNNFIVMQGWMITKLGLGGDELMAYALVYGYTKDGLQWYHGGRKELSEWAGLSERRAGDCLNRLAARGLLLKAEIRVRGVKRCLYRATNPEAFLRAHTDGSSGAAASAGVLESQSAADPAHKKDVDNSENDVDNLRNNVDSTVDNHTDKSDWNKQLSTISRKPSDKTSPRLTTKRHRPSDKTSPCLATNCHPYKDINKDLRESVSCYLNPHDGARAHVREASGRNSIVDNPAVDESGRADPAFRASVAQCAPEFTMNQVSAIADCLMRVPANQLGPDFGDSDTKRRLSWFRQLYLSMCDRAAGQGGYAVTPIANRFNYLMGMLRNHAG